MIANRAALTVLPGGRADEGQGKDETDAVQGTPIGCIANAIIDTEWRLEQAEEAAAKEDWHTVLDELERATALVLGARAVALEEAARC